MFNNKKLRSLVAVIATVLVISTGCGNTADKDNGNANSTPPTENVGQNDSSTQTGDDDSTGKVEDSNEVEEPTDSDEITASSIATKITSEIEFGSLLTLNAQEVMDLYGIDPESLLVDGVFMPAMMNVSSAELTIVELKSEEYYDAVEAAMQGRAAHIQKTFEQYLPNQYQNALNYQIIRNGNYILFSISHDQDTVAEIFNSFFTK